MENMVNKKDSFFRIVLNKLKQLGRFIVDDCIKFPAYILTHPLKGFEEFKRYKKGKMSVALLFVILLIFVNILKFQYDGFLVNNNNIKDLNTFAQVAYVAGAVFVATIGNWAVTTLFDGKGNMKEIFMMVCYCLYPLIWSTSVGIILSNILTEDEMAIYTLVNALGIILLAYMFFFGIISVHEYGLVQCLLTILFTVVAVLIVLFACLLFFDLFQKMYGFVYTLYREITLRELLW